MGAGCGLGDKKTGGGMGAHGSNARDWDPSTSRRTPRPLVFNGDEAPWVFSSRASKTVGWGRRNCEEGSSFESGFCWCAKCHRWWRSLQVSSERGQQQHRTLHKPTLLEAKLEVAIALFKNVRRWRDPRCRFLTTAYMGLARLELEVAGDGVSLVWSIGLAKR